MQCFLAFVDFILDSDCQLSFPEKYWLIFVGFFSTLANENLYHLAMQCLQAFFNLFILFYNRLYYPSIWKFGIVNISFKVKKKIFFPCTVTEYVGDQLNDHRIRISMLISKVFLETLSDMIGFLIKSLEWILSVLEFQKNYLQNYFLKNLSKIFEKCLGLIWKGDCEE